MGMNGATRSSAALAAILLAGTLAGCGGSPPAQQVQSEHQDEAAIARQDIDAALSPMNEAGEEVADAVRNSCVTGQHNYKVDDPYDVLCTLEVYRAYYVKGGDFRDAADSVTAVFPECADSDAEATLRDYWDKLKGTTTHNFPGPYRPDYLPEYRLDCADATSGEGPEVAVTVTGWATLPADDETRSENNHSMGQPCLHDTEDNPCRWDGLSARDIFLFDVANEDGWIVFVEGRLDYAEVR